MQSPSKNDPPIENNTTRRRFLKSVLSVAALGAGGWYGIDTDRLTVERRDVAISGWPQERHGFTIGQLSDLHCDCDKAVERIARAVAMLTAQRPDVVVLTGDFITYKPHRWAAVCARLLEPLLACPGGVYCVLGNHDWWSGGGGIVASALRQVGLTVLDNQSVSLPTAPGIQFVGLDDFWAKKADVRLALQNAPHDAHKILLVHEPDYADSAPAGFSLQLSGHSHAGQIRLPGIPPMHCPTLGRKYPEGLQQAKNHLVYTTRGVGLIGPQLRYFCPPEITVLRLISA